MLPAFMFTGFEVPTTEPFVQIAAICFGISAPEELSRKQGCAVRCLCHQSLWGSSEDTECLFTLTRYLHKAALARPSHQAAAPCEPGAGSAKISGRMQFGTVIVFHPLWRPPHVSSTSWLRELSRRSVCPCCKILWLWHQANHTGNDTEGLCRAGVSCT